MCELGDRRCWRCHIVADFVVTTVEKSSCFAKLTEHFVLLLWLCTKEHNFHAEFFPFARSANCSFAFETALRLNGGRGCGFIFVFKKLCGNAKILKFKLNNK